MSAPTNRWKLGAFVLGTTLLALVAAALLAARTMQVDAVTYVSYLDEAVTGLSVGSPVTFRGVQIGNVSAIAVAPDRRHVEVSYALGVAELARLGLTGQGRGQERRIAIPPDLRVQLASTGLTGTKFLQLDFFDTDGAPPPVLPFPVPDHTIPTTPSTMKNLEASVVRAVEQLPDLARELHEMATALGEVVDDVRRRGLPGRTEAALDGLGGVLTRMQAKLDQLPVDELSRSAAATMARLDRVLARLDGEAGLLASAQRTSDRVGDVAGPRLGPGLEATARDLREAAVAVRQLAEALQRDPDMLLKGKARVQP